MCLFGQNVVKSISMKGWTVGRVLPIGVIKLCREIRIVISVDAKLVPLIIPGPPGTEWRAGWGRIDGRVTVAQGT